MKLIEAVQWRLAVVAIGQSTVRGKGRSGVADAAHEFLRGLPLVKFAVEKEKTFVKQLDWATEELVERFPEDAQHWGLARKCLNIFLADAFFNRYTYEEFGLASAEPFFEIPLDSITGKYLRKRNPEDAPRWTTIKDLNHETSDAYQDLAAEMAKAKNMTRVHLDIFLWVRGRKAAKRAKLGFV
jgi:hypothetical protein